MNEDIVPALLEKIEKEFEESFKNDKRIESLLLEIKEGKADYNDANEFAVRSGEILAEIFEKFLTDETLPDSRMYYNIGERILHKMFKNNFDKVTSSTLQIQNSLNNKANIGLKPQSPYFDEERVKSLVNLADHAEKYSQVSPQIQEAIINFSQNIVDETIRVNAELHHKTGLTPKIIRTVVGGCCEWCQSVSGIFRYPDVPKDVYRRHDNCRCTVSYNPGDGKYKTVFSVYSKKKIDTVFEKQKEAEYLSNSLIIRAKSMDMVITKELKEISAKGSGHLVGLNYRIKSQESLIRKILDKSEDKKIDVKEYAKKVTDVLRYTSVSNKENLVSDYFRFIESLKNKGYNIVEVNNSFLLKNNPYKGINTLIKAKNGYVFELQFHTPQSLEVKETNHSLYEEFRLSKTTTQRKQELLDLMIQKSNQIEIPDFVEKIENRR